jgi:hypothetical protein
MRSWSQKIAPYVEAEIVAAKRAEAKGEVGVAFAHLERAHILGQQSTVLHVRVHGLMLGWGWRHKVIREVFGQILRLVGAATKTFLGLVPRGNTGGTNISPFRSLPIPPDLEVILRSVEPPR